MNRVSTNSLGNKVFYENDVIFFDNSPFLFLRQQDSGQHQYQYFLGERTLTEQKYEQFSKNIAFNVDYCSRKKIAYQHIVFPAKIPVFCSLFAEAGIDVKPIFCESHKNEHVQFPYSTLDMKTDFMVQDTHNSDAGKIKLVKFMMSQLNVDYDDLLPVWKDADVVGDMGKRLGKRGYRERQLVGFEGDKIKPKLFSTASALSGNSGQIFFSINQNAKQKARLLLLGDSFLHTCLNIFAHQFNEVIYLRSPFVIPDIADNLEPDYILTSNAERYLTSIQDAEAKKPYFLNYFNSAFNPSNFSLPNKEALFALFSGRRSHTYNVWKREVVKELL